MQKDEWVRVIDYLAKGKAGLPPYKRKPIAQVVGELYFSLLEVVPRKDVQFELGERIYIGGDVREQVDHIERRIKYEWLTPTAKSELPIVLEGIVRDREDFFIQFYNTSGTISLRQHKLERLPRIGKKHLMAILAEREKEPFKNFEDLHQRLKSIPDPVKSIADEIGMEIKGEGKYRLFVPVVREWSTR